MWLPRYPKVGEYIYYKFAGVRSICKVIEKHEGSKSTFEIERIYINVDGEEDWHTIEITVAKLPYNDVEYKFFKDKEKAVSYAVMERL